MDVIKLTRVELYEMVWNEPMSAIAKRYNITDTGLRKACSRMNIPTPSHGHWMKLLHGKDSPKIELPGFYDGNGIFEIRQLGEETVITEESDLSRIRKEILADARLDLKVPLTLKNACSLVQEVAEIFKKREKDKYYKDADLWLHRRAHLDVIVNREYLNRMLCFADALIKNLKIRGHEVIIENNETKIDLYGEKLQILFRECQRREIIKDPRVSWESSRLVPTGVLALRTNGYPAKEWKDGSKAKLEEQLPGILAQLEIMGAKRKVEMDRCRAQWAIRDKERELEKQRLERKQSELLLYESLAKEAKLFNEAQVIRNYVTEVENRIGSETLPIEKNLDWIKWAKEKADWIDPLVAKNDLILGDYLAIIESKNR